MSDVPFVIGSHNTMTANKPKTIFGYIGNIFAKCQSKSYQQLLNEGVRCFDIRLAFKNGFYNYQHGLVNYGDNPKLFYDIFPYINNYVADNKEIAVIRLIFERGNTPENVSQFINICHSANEQYSNLIFIGGNRKGDWKKLYDFENGITDSDVYQWVSSMAEDARWYEKICPWLYTKRMNKINFEKAKDIGKGIHLFDFL